MYIISLFFFKNPFLIGYHKYFSDFIKICLANFYTAKCLLLKVGLISELSKSYLILV